MIFDLKKSIDILERTSFTLEYLIIDISDEWALSNEGHDTFSPFDVWDI